MCAKYCRDISFEVSSFIIKPEIRSYKLAAAMHQDLPRRAAAKIAVLISTIYVYIYIYIYIYI